jgi:hypothetical protein
MGRPGQRRNARRRRDRHLPRVDEIAMPVALTAVVQRAALIDGELTAMRAGETAELCLQIEVHDALVLPDVGLHDFLWSEGIETFAVGTMVHERDEPGRGLMLDVGGLRLRTAARQPLPSTDRVRLLGHLSVWPPRNEADEDPVSVRSWTVKTIERCRVHSIDDAGWVTRTVTDLAAVPAPDEHDADSLYLVRLSVLPRLFGTGFGLVDALRGH